MCHGPPSTSAQMRPGDPNSVKKRQPKKLKRPKKAVVLHAFGVQLLMIEILHDFLYRTISEP